MIHLSLSQRVKLTFITSFILLSLISMVLVFAATKTIEDHIFETQLLLKIEQYQQDKSNGIHSSLPQAITVYSNFAELPFNLGRYINETRLGVYELKHPEDLDYHYAITENVNKEREIFLFDVNSVELSEEIEREVFKYILIGFIILLIVFFLIFQLVVNRALAPMFQLIEQVKQQTYQPQQQLKYQHPDDNELGLLYKTFGNYSNRIEEFVQREQEFSGFASHELRTPVMIIKGATELLQLQQQEYNYLSKPLERIARATNNMEDIIEMLLSLSREQHSDQSQLEPIDVAFRQVFTAFDDKALQHNKTITVNGMLSNEFGVEKIPAEIVFSNILRNAIQHSDTEHINIKLMKRSCVVSNTIIAEQTVNAKRALTGTSKQGYGLGKLIIERVCAEYHWQYKEWVEKDIYFAQIDFTKA